jgi:type I restriction enzyme, S subunit
MAEWKEYKLVELSTRITKGTTPTTLGMKFVDSGINFVKAEAFNYNGRIDKSSFTYIDELTHEKLKRSQLKKDDILFSMAGVYLGKTAIVTEDILPANTNQALGIIRLNKEKANYKYIYYYLKQKSIIDLVNNYSGQSAQPNINLEEIGSIEILLPSLPEQQAIAEVLSSLDDKIDLLHRQNKTLEALAEILFRQWFVEEAKESWESGTITDLVELNPKRSLSKETAAPYLEMSNLSNELYYPHGWYDRIFTSGTKFINGDTLLARITPCLENGKTAYVDFLKDDEVGWGSTEFIVMRAKAPLHPFFSYILARHNDFRNFAIGCMVGSSGRQRADVENIATYEMQLPPQNIINRFNEYVEPSLQKMKINNNQIRTLTKLRDALLPKLMSGEVRVNINEAETAIASQ